jgi:hypothetical protein
LPGTAGLADALAAGGIDRSDVVVDFVPETVVELGRGGG